MGNSPRLILKVTLTIITILLMTLISVPGCSRSSPTNTYTVTPAADFTSAVEKAIQAVVTIEVDLGAGRSAAGTGWIVDPNGHIVTNNHVVTGAQAISITLYDGRQFTSKAVRADPAQDLAVVKIEASGLPTASTGDSSLLRMGQPVAAIGNALDMGIRVTGGVVSRLDVTVTYQGNNLTLYHNIETDAVLNPGNSGGILVNISGEVVGITNAALEGTNTDLEGFDYAISINEAMPIINSLISQIP